MRLDRNRPKLHSLAPQLPGRRNRRSQRLQHIQVLRGSVVDQEPKVAEAEAERLLETLAGIETG